MIWGLEAVFWRLVAGFGRPGKRSPWMPGVDFVRFYGHVEVHVEDMFGSDFHIVSSLFSINHRM